MQQISARTIHGSPQAMQHGPDRLIPARAAIRTPGASNRRGSRPAFRRRRRRARRPAASGLPRCLGPDDELQSEQLHEIEHLLELHRRLAVFDLDDKAISRVGEFRQFELRQGELLAPVANDGAQVGRRQRRERQARFIAVKQFSALESHDAPVWLRSGNLAVSGIPGQQKITVRSLLSTPSDAAR